MKKSTRVFGLTALLAVMVALALWRGDGSSRPAGVAAGAPKPGPDAPSTPQALPPATRTEQLRPAAPPAATCRSVQDRVFAQARTLEQDDSPPDATGFFLRRRVLETGEKYRFVRTEERWQRDPVTGQDSLKSRVAMAADHLLVSMGDAADVAVLRAQIQRLGGSILRQVPNSRMLLVATGQPTLRAFDSLLAKLRQGPAPVEFAEPDYMVFASFTPDDPSFGQLWGLNNTGQTGGTPDTDIDAPEAWDITRGSDSVTVGVVDTGVDYAHPDLAANVWTNADEIGGNGIDDDNNGYVDDVRGWNFFGETNDPQDDHYHGTHCAGTIGAVGNNGLGVAGVAHRVRIMPLKFLSSSGSGYTSDAVEAVLYATANGAQLTSNSWGGGGYSQALKDAIDAARTAGVLFVAAAGNESSDADLYPAYPAAYDSANIISVAATDSTDTLAYFSNYGANTVDLAAPGVDIYSTSPQSGYRSLSGTSMACPHVAGACVLMKAANPAMTWNEIKAALLANVDGVPGLGGKMVAGGRLNIARALIITSGPYVSSTAVTVHDGHTSGASGNGDGIVNPGETIALEVTVKNMGSKPAAGTSSVLQIVDGASGVTLLKASQNWGTIAAGASVSNSATPFLFSAAPSVQTPQRLRLRLVTTDSGAHSWNSEVELTIFTSSVVSGRVTALAGGTPIAGATVGYTGPSSGNVVTDAGGAYQLRLLDGSYVFSVRAAGFNPSAPLTVTVPGDRTNVDFALGRSRIQVSPTSLSSTQNDDQIKTKSLLVTNSGDAALSVSLGAVSAAASAADLRPRVRTVARTSCGGQRAEEHAALPTAANKVSAATALPFHDGFESGTFSDWTVDSAGGSRSVTSATAAVGTFSFDFVNSGQTGHFTGIHRELAAGSRPRNVSFWVRTGSTTDAAGYVVLPSQYGEAIWFFADDNGCFYVNADTGGDNTVPYQANTWYHVEFRNLDWTAHTFDYYVNGALEKATIAFRDPSTTQISGVYLYNFSPNSEAWWDDIRVSAQSVDWLGYSPASFTLAPGQSTTVSVTFDSTNLIEGAYAGTLELYSNDPANPVIGVPVSLAVQYAPNTPPVANSRTVSLNEDTPVVVTLTGTDADNNPLSAFITQLPASGTLFQTTDGSTPATAISTVPAKVTHPNWKVIYQPAPNVNGTVPFQFVLKDKRSQSNTATVSLVIAPVNDAPLAYNDSASSLPGQGALTIAVLANDSDPDGDGLSIASFTQPAHGTVTAGASGTLVYTPAPTFVEGADSFTYTINDGHGGTATARVSINIGYLAAGDWSMFGNTAAHTGYYPASLGGKRFVENWTVNYVRPLTPVAIAEGRVFAATQTAAGIPQATAFDLATGLPTWRHDFAEAHSLTGPSYQNGRIFLQRGNSSDSQLWSLDAKTGATVWSAPFGAQWESYLPPTVNDTGVYINGGTYGGLYGFARASGSQLFFQSLDQYDGWTPTVLGNRVFSFVKGIFREHNPSTGASLWSSDFGWRWNGSTMNRTAACGIMRAYFVNDSVAGTELITLDHTTRAVLWRVAGSFRGTPAVANGTVYVIADGAIRAFQSATGTLIGDYSTGGSVCINQPLVTNDAVIASNGSSTYVFDLVSRRLLQTIGYGGCLSLSNGALLIAGGDATLRCYRVDTGNNPAPVAPDRTVTGVEDSTLAITLSGTDANGDALVSIVTALPANGTLYQTTDGVAPGQPFTAVPALVTHPAGKVVYRPAADGFGAAYTNFKYKVNDGVFNSAEAAITVDITGLNDAPVANDDSVQLRAGCDLAHFWPTANDLDVDGDVLSIPSFTQPAHGTVTREADGSLHYTPAAGFIDGTDTFGYTASDALGVTDSAVVTVTVSDSFGREWPTFGGSSLHTGGYPGFLGLEPFSLRWSFDAGRSINPVAVAEGKVFCTVTGNWNDYMPVAALDAVTGAEVWRREFAPGHSLCPPSYFNGAVYLQRGNHSSDSQMIVLAAGSGETDWTAPFSPQWEEYMAPAVSEAGLFFYGGSYGGGIYGFDLDGTKRFSVGIGYFDGWTPLLYDGRVFSFVEGVFQEHSPATGVTLWSLDFGWNWSGYSMNRTVSCSDGRAFLINDAPAGGNELIAVDLASRGVSWKVVGAFTGTPAIVNGTVYALAGRTVRCFGAAGGQPLGSYAAPEGTVLAGAPVIAGDLVFAASASSVYVFNRVTRVLLQTLAGGGEIAVADNVLFVAGGYGDQTVRAYCHVPATNTVPVAQPIQAGILEEASVVLKLEATDPDRQPLKYVVRTLPAQGTLYQTTDGVAKGAVIGRVPALVQNGGGLVIYEAPLDAVGDGVGTFTFTAHDPYTGSVPAVVRLDVAPVNDAPAAVDDTVALRPRESLHGYHPEANDRDTDDDLLRIVAFTQGASGTVAQNADGSIDYTPRDGFLSGTDSFSYTVEDVAGAPAAANVTVVVSETVGQEWPTFGGGPDHTGYQPLQLGADDLVALWSVGSDGGPYQVAAADGRAYLSLSSAHRLLALDLSSGGELWRVDYPSMSVNAPSAFGGNVFIQCGNSSQSRLFAVKGGDGASLWASPFTAQWESYLAPAVDTSGVYIDGGTYGGIYGYDTVSGAQRFFQSLEQYDGWTPTVSDGRVFSFVKGVFREHNATSGATLWSLDFGWNWAGYTMNRTTAVADGRAFLVNDSVTVPSGGRDLIGIDLGSHAVLWKARAQFVGTPATAHHAVYAIEAGKAVNAYDATTGHLLGVYAAPASETGLFWQPILTNDALIVASATKTYLFDLRTRRLRQTIPFGGYLSLAGYRLMIASADGFVRCFAAADPANHLPVAQAQSLATNEDTTLAVTLHGQDEDNDPLKFTITRLPAAGALYRTADGSTRGAIIGSVPALITGTPAKVLYVPPAERNGTGFGDFGYAASDGKGLSAEASVTIEVISVNDAPVAHDDDRITTPGQILSPVNETANDFDADGDLLRVVAFTQPTLGRIQQNADGTLCYLPPKEATSGATEFSYTVSDPTGATATATVHLRIEEHAGGFWPTFGNGPAHTGYTALALGRGGFTERWHHSSGTYSPNQVVVADNLVLFSSHLAGGTFGLPVVRALAESSGVVLWTATFADAYSVNPPSYYDGRVYFQRGKGLGDTPQLFALDAMTGQTDWVATFGAQWEQYMAPTVSSQGVFVNGGVYGGMYGFKPDTGAPLFFTDTLGQCSAWTPSLLGDSLYTFVDGVFSERSPTTGAAWWTVGLGYSWYGYAMNRTVALDQRRALLTANTNSSGELVCIDLDLHTILWRVAGGYSGTPAVNGGVVYALKGNAVEARLLADGSALGTFNAAASDYLVAQPVVTDDLVIASSAQKTFIFGRNDFALLQTLPRGGPITVADDQIIVASGDGTITAYGAAPAVTFSPAGGTFAQPVTVTLNAADPQGRIYYTSDGSAPDFSSRSLLPGRSLTVSSSLTIRAILVSGSRVSRICEASYTLAGVQADTDADGLPDWWEQLHFGGLTQANTTTDHDGDGARDIAEFAAGTDPLDARDVLSLACGPSAGGFDLVWSSKSDRLYTIEESTDLTVWTATVGPLEGTGASMTQTRPAGTDHRHFYRLRVGPNLVPPTP